MKSDADKQLKDIIERTVGEILSTNNELTFKTEINGYDYELTRSVSKVDLDEGYYVGTYSGYEFKINDLSIKLNSGIRGTSPNTKAFVKDEYLYLSDSWSMTRESTTKYFDSLKYDFI